jgi:uncharacterized protein
VSRDESDSFTSGRPPRPSNWRLDAALTYIHGMAVDPSLLEILVCPECKTPVHPVHDDAALKCETCHRVYPVKDDIPVMLIDEATIEN